MPDFQKVIAFAAFLPRACKIGLRKSKARACLPGADGSSEKVCFFANSDTAKTCFSDI